MLVGLGPVKTNSVIFETTYFFNLDLCVWGLQPRSTDQFQKDAVLLSGFTSFLWMERLICVKNTGFQKHLDLCRQGLRGMLPDKILKF